MLTSLLFFVLMAAALSALVWSGMELFLNQEDPLGDRLDELQAHAMVSPNHVKRRKSGSGPLGRFLYVVGLFPAPMNGCTLRKDCWRGPESAARTRSASTC